MSGRPAVLDIGGSGSRSHAETIDVEEKLKEKTSKQRTQRGEPVDYPAHHSEAPAAASQTRLCQPGRSAVDGAVRRCLQQ
jgi:hypothetical protein